MNSTRPDFVIALVGAVGSLLAETSAQLVVELERYGYQPHVLKISKAFSDVTNSVSSAVDEALTGETTYPTDGRYREIRRAMATGRAARERYQANHRDEKNGCLADLVVHAISKLRSASPGPWGLIVDSLKTPAELGVLRRVYGGRVLAIGVHTPQHERQARLVHRIQQTVGRTPEAVECAMRLMGIDEKERGTPFGQHVEAVFSQCDAFVVAHSNDGRLRSQLERLARLIFLAPFETPTAAEAAMMHAFTASLASASMSRQVGAALTTERGDIVSTGCNEVPRYGGGPYRSEHDRDGRDFTRGQDENIVKKADLVRQVLAVAQQEGLVGNDVNLVAAAHQVSNSSRGRDMLARNLTEFGRDVHAEMAALNAATRRGAPTLGCLLYTTTFPCHNCAKHILDAGISTVRFIEAYPKSFAEDFHRDSLSLERAEADHLLIQAFEGVAPRAYATLFAWRARRDDNTGHALSHSPLSARPWFTLVDGVTDNEIERREGELLKNSKGRLEAILYLDRAIASLLPDLPRSLAKASRTSDAPPSLPPPSSGARQTG